MDIKLGTDHDLKIVDNDLSLTTTLSETLAQRLKIKLLTFQGEWFLDANLGIPYYQSILGKNRAKETIDIIFKDAIIEEPDVLSLVSFSSSLDSRNRIYSIKFKAVSATGQEEIPVELEIGA